MDNEREILEFRKPALLAGPADMDINLFRQMKNHNFAVIAADGGANKLIQNNIIPDAIIGDLDSVNICEEIASRTKIIRLEEQDSTDFEKCLYSVISPLFLAFGFTGKRFDHTLATLHGMTKYHGEKNVLLFSGSDISFIHHGDFSISGESGQIFSIIPVKPICFSHSDGLLFPLDGLEFEMGSNIGTSNCASGGKIGLFPSPKHQTTPYLITLGNDRLEELLGPHL